MLDTNTKDTNNSANTRSPNRRYYHTHQQRRHQAINRCAFINNHQYQQAPFQPASYHLNAFSNHQHNQQLIDKYNKKFNLISFCLLRKQEDLFNNETYYLKDDIFFKEIRIHLDKQNYDALVKLLLSTTHIKDDLSSLTTTSLLLLSSTYNCSLFVYIIRECLDTCNTLNQEFTRKLLKFVLNEALPLNYHLLTDGDYPLRNVLHYAAKYNNTQIVDELRMSSELMLKMCLALDYNLNTPIHFACMFDSFDFLRQVPHEIIKKFENVFNDDGLNPFLLACKHSSLPLVRYLVEQCNYDYLVREKKCPQQGQHTLNKNCLHFTCARFNSLDINKYLYELDTRLAYETANIVGSIYHVLASNITRLNEFNYFLSVYERKRDLQGCLAKLDFRSFNCVDCFVDTLINLRHMVPTHKTFYEYFFGSTQNQVFKNDQELRLVINKCLYRLLENYRAKITQLPLIKSKLQLLEFLKILNFMAKLAHFHTHFDNVSYSLNFEAFCLKFLNTFIFSGDLLADTTSTQLQIKLLIEISDQNNNSTSELITSNESLLAEIYNELVELTKLILLSGRYSHKFQSKIFTFMKNFLINVSYSSRASASTSPTSISPKSSDTGIDVSSSSSSISRDHCDTSNKYIHSMIMQKIIELNKSNFQINVLSLKDLARREINRLLQAKSQLNYSHILNDYLKLPQKYYSFINYLSFNLMQDLFGNNFDLNQLKDENRIGEFL